MNTCRLLWSGVLPRLVATACVFPFAGGGLFGQAPGVPIIRDRGETSRAMVDRANALREAGQLLDMERAKRQLARARTALKLPSAARTPLSDLEIWRRTRAAHVRIGWHYLCQKCEHWHQDLAGGYFVTADGVVATSQHVVDPSTDFRDGFLVAANEAGEILPVLEVLAANETTDAALLRVQARGRVTFLPLNTDVNPSDEAWCYSDPLGRKNYFSKGIVNRFYYHRHEGEEIVRMEVSTDWAPGSSGAAIVDRCGNAIGHVSEISSGGGPRGRGTNQTTRASGPYIVFHSATRAKDVLDLVQRPDKAQR